MLDTLRQPLESGEVVLHRAHGAARYPARFQLVMAANPCPCGNFHARGGACTCTPMQRRRYFSRLSGPLLDRIDMRIDVEPVRRGAVASVDHTAAVAARVARARWRAAERLAGTPFATNATVSARWLHAHTGAAAVPARRALETGAVSARGVDRALRLAWTLADLDGIDGPTEDHVRQALALRMGAS